MVTISEVDALMDVKLLAPYKSPEAKNFIPEFKDSNGYWTAIYTNYTTIGYNPKPVPDKEPFSPRMEQSKLKLQTTPPETGGQFQETIRDFREIFGL